MTNREFAIARARVLTRNSMIRLTAEAESLWVYDLGGKKFVGYPVTDPVPHLMDSSKPIRKVEDANGNAVYMVQSL